MQTKSTLNSMITDQTITRRTLAGDLPTLDYTEAGVVLWAKPLKDSTKDPSILSLIDSYDTFNHYSRNNWLRTYPEQENSVVDLWNDWIAKQYYSYGIISSILTGLQPYLLFENNMFRLVENEFDTGWCSTVKEAKDKWNSIMTPLYDEKLLMGDTGFPILEAVCHTVYEKRASGVPEYFSIRGRLKGLPRGKLACETVDEAIHSWNDLVTLLSA